MLSENKTLLIQCDGCDATVDTLQSKMRINFYDRAYDAGWSTVEIESAKSHRSYSLCGDCRRKFITLPS